MSDYIHIFVKRPSLYLFLRSPRIIPYTHFILLITELGAFIHSSEDDMVFKSTNEKIPYFNAPAFLENKQKIGKVDEIFGPINEVMFTVKPDQGIVAASWKVNDKVYISPDRLLPLTRFTKYVSLSLSLCVFPSFFLF